MKYFAEINIMPLKALLDPQGKAVTLSMHNIGYKSVENVRIGKHITLEIDAENIDGAKEKVREACKKILSNPIMESFEFSIKELV
ncbi:MAG: phosphoribosylformylglycinamidine synthase subunit PurS [Bacteroidetes bacterium]|jgi:phosphoribosylformylglycinamidine synthase subunit PurS|nr:phosphoribosylformylglycinamidine synthase subunit PurS [Bacteroidota bacterium]MBT6685385.1 phosphoribosylformylglycinamidine synthase subunit PurS [Bacteroidota bacterium]MBT7145035.1 phosphoribosylformylglycinamidine synthase subunit PurS [Bacteroidota bacterium]MBT7492720.1 phosphoribosylformylglycinamidine synthase subunit PurS [Bacteroidota bacterium]